MIRKHVNTKEARWLSRNQPVPFRLAGLLIAGLALLPLVRSAATAEQREIAEEAFAARAANLAADRATNTLVRWLVSRPQASVTEETTE